MFDVLSLARWVEVYENIGDFLEVPNDTLDFIRIRIWAHSLGFALGVAEYFSIFVIELLADFKESNLSALRT